MSNRLSAVRFRTKEYRLKIENRICQKNSVGRNRFQNGCSTSNEIPPPPGGLEPNHVRSESSQGIVNGRTNCRPGKGSVREKLAAEKREIPYFPFSPSARLKRR